MKLFGIFGTPDAPKRVIPVDTDRALELIVGRAKVIAAIEAFITQTENVERARSGYGQVPKHDMHLLEEARVVLVEVLQKEGIKLEEVPGKYDRSIDESVETFVAAYQKQEAERLAADAAPVVEEPAVDVVDKADEAPLQRAA